MRAEPDENQIVQTSALGALVPALLQAPQVVSQVWECRVLLERRSLARCRGLALAVHPQAVRLRPLPVRRVGLLLQGSVPGLAAANPTTCASRQSC